MGTNYFKKGNIITLGDASSQEVSQVLPVANYILKVSPFGSFYLEITDDFFIPEKIYGTTGKIADRTLHTFETRPKTTGVLLSGEKGSGKTLLGKLISTKAREKGIATIIINYPFTGDSFASFLSDIQEPAILLFDEFEKVYDSDKQKELLTILDGVLSSNKLFVLTCNEVHKIDRLFMNRPGRMYYHIKYTTLDKDTGFINDYLEDKLEDREKIPRTTAFLQSFMINLNFDMLQAIVEEMNRYNEDVQEVLQYINVSSSNGRNNNYIIELIDETGKLLVPSTTRHRLNPFVISDLEIEFFTSREAKESYKNIEKKIEELSGIENDEEDEFTEDEIKAAREERRKLVAYLNTFRKVTVYNASDIIYSDEKTSEFRFKNQDNIILKIIPDVEEVYNVYASFNKAYAI